MPFYNTTSISPFPVHHSLTAYFLGSVTVVPMGWPKNRFVWCVDPPCPCQIVDDRWLQP